MTLEHRQAILSCAGLAAWRGWLVLCAALAGCAPLAYARTNLVPASNLLPIAAAAPPGSNNSVNATVTIQASPSTNVAGYRLYWGVRLASYTNSLDAGTNLTVTLAGLVRGVRYYLAATAYNPEGLQSPFSGEMIFPAPVTNYASVFVESGGSATGQWTNFWTLTLTNPPGASQFFRFGIRETNSGSVVRLDARTLKIANTNNP